MFLGRFFIYVVFGIIGRLSPCYAAISAPTEVSGLVLWLDAADINGNGVQPADGAGITTWVDKSTTGSNLSRVAGTVQYQATGFKGGRPGVRLPIGGQMTGPNPFGVTYKNTITVFIVSNSASYTKNFALSLNGINRDAETPDGRYSFHLPWNSHYVYSDISGCCGNTRLWAALPNLYSDTTIYTSVNDEPGNRQWLRMDRQMSASDDTGHKANISGGVHIGTIPTLNDFNGRFAEIIVYGRALSLEEVEDIECYLSWKWKPSITTGCSVDVNVTEGVEAIDTNGQSAYALPGNDVIYTLNVTHDGGPPVDTDTIYLIKDISTDTIFYNDDIDGAGPETDPVAFSDNGASGLSLDYVSDVGYSNSTVNPTNMTQCGYVPLAGYDPDVRYVCINPSGSFQPNSSFTVKMRAKIK